MSSDSAILHPVLSPSSIAVVGASEDQEKPGGRVLSYLRDFGYEGRVLPVNPRYRKLQGVRCYRSILDVPVAPDLAFLAVPAGAVLQTAKDCVAARVRSAVIAASGFAEVGDSGEAVEAQLLEIARDGATRLVGPNSQGVANFQTGAVASFSSLFASLRPSDGPVAVLSQSGAMAVVPYTHLRGQGIGVRYSIATGNEADLSVGELLDAVLDDPEIRLVLLYLESIRKPETLAAAAEVAHQKGVPIVALTAGRSVAGRSAARSHTAALSSDAEVADAFLDRVGIYRVDTVREMVFASRLYLRGWRAPGKRLVVLTDSGASCVLAADSAARRGLVLPQFAARTNELVEAEIPGFGAAGNPIDMTSALRGDPDMLDRVLGVLGRESAADMLLLSLPASGAGYDTRSMASAAKRFADRSGLPFAVMVPQDEVSAPFAEAGLPVFSEDDEAVQALAQVAAHSSLLERPLQRPSMLAGEETAGQPRETVFLDEAESLGLLRAHGLPVVWHRRCRSFEEALDAFRAAKSKVVLKACTRRFPHKSRLGLVHVGIETPEELRAAFDSIRRRSEELGVPDVSVLVGKMEDRPYELIAGARWDPLFGVVVVIGTGGVRVEDAADHEILLPPFDLDAVAEATSRLRSADRWSGNPGVEQPNLEAVGKVAVGLADFLVSRRPSTSSVEVNPLLVGERDGIIVDALVETEDRQR